jgi:hypothetical protein
MPVDARAYVPFDLEFLKERYILPSLGSMNKREKLPAQKVTTVKRGNTKESRLIRVVTKFL